MNKFIKTDKKMLNALSCNALHQHAVSASNNAHRVTINSRRINDATVAPSLTKRNIAFSLNMFVNECNNIINQLKHLQH